jgi:hypothetical protein
MQCCCRHGSADQAPQQFHARGSHTISNSVPNTCTGTLQSRIPACLPHQGACLEKVATLCPPLEPSTLTLLLQPEDRRYSHTHKVGDAQQPTTAHNPCDPYPTQQSSQQPNARHESRTDSKAYAQKQQDQTPSPSAWPGAMPTIATTGTSRQGTRHTLWCMWGRSS